MSSYSAWDEKHAGEIIDGLKSVDGATLPILHALQDAFGHITERAIEMIADALNLSRADVHGVVSFYHDFRRELPGRYVLKLCRAEACQSMGADALAATAKSQLGVDWHGTSADGRVTLEPVFCLGLCSCAPAAMIDGKLVGRLDDTALAAAIKQARA
ncbi:MAG: formate dehydrogenase subunit gamma [Proteobacteria bacterium]|nr:formate dehydrogenase subunit gamma [Pseudomonadota bacterium]